MNDKNERERLQRIRDAQITARDPGPSKIRGYDWEAHARRGRMINQKRREERKPLLIDLFYLMPGRWKGAVIGCAIGLIVILAAEIFLTDEWVLLGVAGLIVCGVVGFVLGATLQEKRPDSNR